MLSAQNSTSRFDRALAGALRFGPSLKRLLLAMTIASSAGMLLSACGDDTEHWDGWRYEVSPPVEGRRTYKAEVASESDQALYDFQYSSYWEDHYLRSRLYFSFNKAKDRTRYIKLATYGSYDCYDYCTVEFRFDDGPVHRYWAYPSGQPDLIIDDPESLEDIYERTKAAKRVIISVRQWVDYYDAPYIGYGFNVAGLDIDDWWK